MSIVVEFYIPEKTRKESMTSLSKYFPAKCIKNIERGIYDHTEQYCSMNTYYFTIALAIYKHHVQDLLFNLEQDNKSIHKIKKDITKGKFNEYNLAFMSPSELNEDQWKAILIKKAITEDKLNNLPTITWRACRDCKGTQYSYYQLQTRSADEPMTTFYICKDCGKTYRVNK